MKYYWLLPGKELDDGLRVIHSDADTNTMCSVVDRIKNLIVYFDHDDDTVFCAPWDDVVVNPSAQQPKVVSPENVVEIEKKQANTLPEFLSPMKEQAQHNDSDSDEDSEVSNFWDSDNEVSDGDDDLVVDEDVPVEATNTTKAKKAKGSRLKRDGSVVTLDLSSDDADDTDDELLLPVNIEMQE